MLEIITCVLENFVEYHMMRRKLNFIYQIVKYNHFIFNPICYQKFLKTFHEIEANLFRVAISYERSCVLVLSFIT